MFLTVEDNWRADNATAGACDSDVSWVVDSYCERAAVDVLTVVLNHYLPVTCSTAIWYATSCVVEEERGERRSPKYFVGNAVPPNILWGTPFPQTIQVQGGTAIQ